MGSFPLTVDTGSGAVTLSDDRSYVLGRGQACDVVVEDTRISRRHLVLEPGPAGWTVRDTSANGMWRDGRKVPSADVGAGEVVLRLGSADGPAVRLACRPPAAHPLTTPDAELAGAATQLGSRGAPPPLPARAATAAATADAPTPPSGSAPLSRISWLRALPTLLWLTATGFALGALIALS
jgi:Inner membrane component of T3SS, cytoplasmic domain